MNIDYLVAEVEVAETDVSKLQKGQEVDLQFSAYPDVIKGYVESWPAIGEITSRGATIVKVKIRIDQYPSAILPNFSFTGKIQIESPVDNLIVERNAIGYENKKAFVVLAKNEEKKDVKVVPYGKEYVKILEGLEGGERLLQQTKSPKSGQNQQRNNSNSQRNNGNGTNRNGNGQSGGMPGGGMPPM